VVRVFPTLRGWLVLGGAFLWLAVGEVNHNAPCLILGAGLLALFVTGLPFALTAVRGFDLERGAPGEAVVGHRVDLPLVLRNRLQRRRSDVIVVENLPFTGPGDRVHLVSRLGPVEERIVPRGVLVLRRGEFDLNVVRLRGGDPAGLFATERRFHLPQRVLIFPASEPLPDLRFQQERAIAAPTGNPFGQAGTSLEFYGIRTYNPADGLRCIHWKSSARLGRLMVREFERTGIPSLAVLLDAQEKFVSGDDYWSNLEYLVRVAASLCRHAGGLYCRIAFAAGGAEEILIPSRFSTRGEWEMLRALALLRPGPIGLAEIILRLGETLPRRTHVFCFSLSSAPGIKRALALLQQHGMQVHWLCAPPEAFIVRSKGLSGFGPARPKSQRAGTGPSPVMVHPGMPVPHLFRRAVEVNG